MKLAIKTTILSLGLLAATAAHAADAIVTTDLNLRTGPGIRYLTITSIPNRAIVDVRGCMRGYNWCQVGYRGIYGWASTRYLAMPIDQRVGNSADFGHSAAAIGIPLIAGVILGTALNNNSNDRYDRDRYDRYNRRDNNWSRRDGPRYLPNPPQWNGGVGIGNGVQPNNPNTNPSVPIGRGVQPSQGGYYNPYND